MESGGKHQNVNQGRRYFFFFFNESVSCRLVARMGGQGKEEPFSGPISPKLLVCRSCERAERPSAAS